MSEQRYDERKGGYGDRRPATVREEEVWDGERGRRQSERDGRESREPLGYGGYEERRMEAPAPAPAREYASRAIGGYDSEVRHMDAYHQNQGLSYQAYP